MLSENYEYVPDKLITRACKRQQNANLKHCGQSLSATSMPHRFHDYFIEYQSDKDVDL